MQRDSESLAGLTKLRRETSGVSKLQSVNPLPSPSEPVPGRNSISIGSHEYGRIPKTLQSRTITRKPSNKHQRKRVIAKWQGSQSVALPKEFPNETHESTTEQIPRNVCDVMTTRKLDSGSHHLELSTIL